MEQLRAALRNGLGTAVLGALVLLTGLAVVAASPRSASAGSAVELSDPAATAPQAPAQASRTRSLQPLRVVRQPDLVVTAPRALTEQQLAAVRAVHGVRASVVLARGSLLVGSQRLDVLAGDPSAMRALTPRETAKSDPLWRAVLRGELVSSYGTDLPLGRDVAVSGRGGAQLLRVGGLAVLGLPGDAVVDTAVGEGLGLVPDAVVLSAPKRGIKALERDVRAAVGPGARITVLRPESLVHRRPRTYKELYQQSARYCPGLSWRVLAAIGQVESGHGRNVGPSSAGALGPMQFMPATWAWAGVDGDGDGRADVMSPYDAVPAAALYLCRGGAGRGGRALYASLFSYNHADWYVREVLALAARYR